MSSGSAVILVVDDDVPMTPPPGWMPAPKAKLVIAPTQSPGYVRKPKAAPNVAPKVVAL